jgi:uncharacterized protein YjbI with pentapeptide repeats
MNCELNCELCQSSSQSEFTTEIVIHFGGLKNIDDPGVPAFPKISVCLDCGFSRFVMTQAELARLRRRAQQLIPNVFRGSEMRKSHSRAG